ncbi:MAG: LysM peptidoglycan-binding domain-containing protein [Roseovarius sp.]|nr:LysM peptidoglycan-binding domain-containing protein [Roseovarius sp.]
MSKLAGLASGPALGGAVVAVIVVGVGLYAAGVIGPKATPTADPQAQPAAVQQQQPEAQITQSTPEPVTEPETDVEPASQDAAASPKLPDAPSIDTFRLEPDGTMLVAGQAHPGWTTAVVLDGAELDQVSTDATGQFVAFLSVATSDQPRILSLVTRDPQGDGVVASLDEIIIAPTPARVEPATAEAASETASSTDDPVEPETTLNTQTVLLSDEEGVRVLQPGVPLAPAPEVMSSVALDTITYSQAGDVQLTGRAQGSGFVRVYLDNAPVTSSRIEQSGNWRTGLPEVDTGVYTLRIDETDAEGNVTSRVETPFKREDEALIAQANTGTQAQSVAAITVQPGSTLWAISRERYGEGTYYVRVFEANRDRIRDPDLIYPGQVFNLPE